MSEELSTDRVLEYEIEVVVVLESCIPATNIERSKSFRKTQTPEESAEGRRNTQDSGGHLHIDDEGEG